MGNCTLFSDILLILSIHTIHGFTRSHEEEEEEEVEDNANFFVTYFHKFTFNLNHFDAWMHLTV